MSLINIRVNEDGCWTCGVCGVLLSKWYFDVRKHFRDHHATNRLKSAILYSWNGPP